MRQLNERSAHIGEYPEFSVGFSDSEILAMWTKWSHNCEFEKCAADAIRNGHIKIPAYLSLGSEHIPVALSSVIQGYNIFAQHRAHSYYLSFGGDPLALIDELFGLPTGCTGGRGGSASINNPHIKMWGHSGLMGDQVPIGVGYAIASGEPTLVVMGDASAEEDYVLSAIGYAATKLAPVIFICEDNDLSILTKIETRRSWNLSDVSASFGVPSFDISDDPRLIVRTVEKVKRSLPGLINIRCCRDVWHAGAGNDGSPEWNRREMFREALDVRRLTGEAESIGESEASKMKLLWSTRINEVFG